MSGADTFNVERVLPQQRQPHDILIAIENTNEAILAELRHIRAALGSAERSRSSVLVKTGTNGRPFDIECKAYEGGDILEPEAAAVQSFLRVRAELEDRLMAGFTATVQGRSTK